MKIEIVEEPVHFHLCGIGGIVENDCFGEVGFRLMNEMWQVIKSTQTATTGTNHWVYLRGGRMFVGVELVNSVQGQAPARLELLEFKLPRYLRHLHVGPYQALPQKWKELKAELALRGEVIGSHSLEIYGHHCDDPTQLETTILIGLQSRPERATPTIDRTAFESIYAGQPRWEIGRPQQVFIDVAGHLTGSILDSGCGTGENAFYFASRGHQVTGIDFLSDPVTIATRKAAERSLAVKFLVMDALTLKDWKERFDNVIDSGLFHVFSDDDRRRYVEGLATMLKPNGRFFFLCFSDEEPGTEGPRRISQKEIEIAFADGWTIESIEPSRYEVRLDPKDTSFKDGGPKAWFAVVKKN